MPDDDLCGGAGLDGEQVWWPWGTNPELVAGPAAPFGSWVPGSAGLRWGAGLVALGYQPRAGGRASSTLWLMGPRQCRAGMGSRSGGLGVPTPSWWHGQQQPLAHGSPAVQGWDGEQVWWPRGTNPELVAGPAATFGSWVPGGAGLGWGAGPVAVGYRPQAGGRASSNLWLMGPQQRAPGHPRRRGRS